MIPVLISCSIFLRGIDDIMPEIAGMGCKNEKSHACLWDQAGSHKNVPSRERTENQNRD